MSVEGIPSSPPPLPALRSRLNSLTTAASFRMDPNLREANEYCKSLPVEPSLEQLRHVVEDVERVLARSR